MAGDSAGTGDPSRWRNPPRAVGSVTVPTVARPAVELRVLPRKGEDGARILGRAVAEARGSDLSYLSMPRVDLSGHDLVGQDLSGCDLSQARFEGATLDGVGLEGADLTGANFDGATLRECRIGKARLGSATFRRARLEDCGFTRSDMTGADLSDAVVVDCDLTGATLADIYADDASFTGCRMHRMQLRGSRLVRTAFLDCRIDLAALSRLDLVDVTFDWDVATGILPTEETTFERVTMDGGRIANLQVNRGRLRGIRLNGTDLLHVHMDAPAIDGFRMSDGSASRLSVESGEVRGLVVHGTALDGVRFLRSDVEVAIAGCRDARGLSFEGSQGSLSLSRCDVDGLDLSACDLRYGDMSGSGLAGVAGIDADAAARLGADRATLAGTAGDGQRVPPGA